MDGNDRRRSQYGQPYQSQAQSRPLPGQPMGPPSSDRYSQPATPARTDIGRSSMTRPYVPGYPSYGYQDQQYSSSQMQGSSPIQGVELQYAPAYMQDAPRQQQSVQASPSQQQQQQQYAQYAQGSLLPPVGTTSLYDPMNYQQRQSAAIEVMASQLAVPQYIGQGDHSGVGVASAQPHYMTSQADTSTYASVAVTRPSLPQPYGATHAEYSGIEQPETEGSGGQGAQDALDEGLREYQQRLRSTFDSIISGRVTEASEKILVVSRWLVNSATTLGLHHDDDARHTERVDLWREFNLCWEALGQKQKEITEDALRTRRQPADILSTEAITNLVDELIAFCDTLEPYGLVDFEMGIWEEQITHIFTLCLDLLPRNETTAQSTRVQADPV